MTRENSSWIIAEEDMETDPGKLDTISADDALPTDEETEKAENAWWTGLFNLVSSGTRGYYLLGGVFLLGLFLGWIVIGRWLWPARHNADPWNLRTEHQVNLVSLVAQDYEHTGDVLRAEQALSGWDKDELAALVARMEEQAPNPETRQRLMALRIALALPEHKKSLWASLFEEKLILLSALLSILPLAGAIGLAVYPQVRQAVSKEAMDEVDEMLAQEGGAFDELPTDQERESELSGEVGEIQEGVEEYGDEEIVIGAGPENDQDDEEEGDDWEEDWDESDDEDDLGEGLMADIFTGLFDEDDESMAALEALCKGLDDINVDDLLQRGQKIIHRFQTERPAA